VERVHHARVDERVAFLEARMEVIAELRADVAGLRAELIASRTELRAEMSLMRTDMDRRFQRLEDKVDRQFVWVVGIQMTMFIAFVSALLTRAIR
jgi:hypothetical protein